MVTQTNCRMHRCSAWLLYVVLRSVQSDTVGKLHRSPLGRRSTDTFNIISWSNNHAYVSDLCAGCSPSSCSLKGGRLAPSRRCQDQSSALVHVCLLHCISACKREIKSISFDRVAKVHSAASSWIPVVVRLHLVVSRTPCCRSTACHGVQQAALAFRVCHQLIKTADRTSRRRRLPPCSRLDPNNMRSRLASLLYSTCRRSAAPLACVHLQHEHS